MNSSIIHFEGDYPYITFENSDRKLFLTGEVYEALQKIIKKCVECGQSLIGQPYTYVAVESGLKPLYSYLEELNDGLFNKYHFYVNLKYEPYYDNCTIVGGIKFYDIPLQEDNKANSKKAIQQWFRHFLTSK